MSSDVDALIIGAGPTGLVLAHELVRRKMRVRIIDQLEKPTDQSRALAIHARTLEIFDRLGLAQKMISLGIPLHELELFIDGKSTGKLSLTKIPSKFPFSLILPQSQTEAVLIEALEKLGVKVERPCTCTHAEEGRVLVDGKTISALWIFGCDGAHSTVRHALGVPFKGAKFPEVFKLADVELAEPLAHDRIHGRLSKEGMAGIIPIPGSNLFRLVSTPPQDSPFPIKRTLWESNFQVHRRIVPKMRHGSIFLLGDAAHIHSPAGGQGLNISVQDAYNLAWKIDLVHRKQASDMLLNTFDEERHPIAKHTLIATTIGTHFITSKNLFVRKFFFLLLKTIFHVPFFQKKFAHSLSELASHFQWSSIVSQPWQDVFWKGPKPGCRFPDAPADLKHVLLVFGAPDFSFSHPEVRVEHRPSKRPYLYLIRPDGVVGWRSRRMSSALLASQLKMIFGII